MNVKYFRYGREAFYYETDKMGIVTIRITLLLV